MPKGKLHLNSNIRVRKSLHIIALISVAYLVSLNHRIIESFGLEGTPRGHLVQPPCSEQGHR